MASTKENTVASAKLESLELGIARRLRELSKMVPHHVDAFRNHLTILGNAINYDHDTLKVAVEGAAKELQLERDAFVLSVCVHIDREKERCMKEAYDFFQRVRLAPPKQAPTYTPPIVSIVRGRTLRRA